MNILIGSNGGLTGVYLAKQLRNYDERIILFGSDSSKYSVGRFFVDHQLHLPPANNAEFINRLIALLNENKIDVYLPTHSNEIRVIAKNEETVRSRTKTKFVVCPNETFLELENKAIANQKLTEIGIPVPRIITDYGTDYPIIMKKKMGSGSSGTIIIDNREIHKAYKESKPEVDFYELIKGTEYTVDCMFTLQGSLIGYNQRERVKTIGGAVSITRNCNDISIRPWLEMLSKRWIFRGCVNFQYIVRDGIPYFIDINLRYPSGGLPLSVASGLDIPKMTIDLLLGRHVSSYITPLELNNLVMYRYFEELFD